MEKLINLYKQWAGEEPADVIKLAGQGSNRQYFRIIKQDGDTVIGIIGTSRDAVSYTHLTLPTSDLV